MIVLLKKIQQATTLNEQEAWWMLQHITKRSKEQLYTMKESQLTKEELLSIDTWIYKLTKQSMPLAYLIGSVPFLDLSIKVQPPILIPRPETEEWVHQLIQTYTPHKDSIKKILEIGTGSGCIALSLAKHFNQAKIIATDINPQALQLAQQNAKTNNISNIQFILSDLFKNIDTSEDFDFIVSNPPYINPALKSNMMPQVTQWEDQSALFAPQQGLQILYNILETAPSYMSKKSNLEYQLILEHDANQHQIIKEYAHQLGWTCHQKKDLFGNWRTTWLTYQDQL